MCLLELAQKLAKAKHTSLLRKLVKYSRKKFYGIDTWAPCYKTFFGRNLKFVTKLECLLEQAQKLAKAKHTSLLQTLVNYSRKKFYPVDTWPPPSPYLT